MKRKILIIFCAISSQLLIAQTVLRGVIQEEGSAIAISGARIGFEKQGAGEVSKSNGSFSYRKYDKVLDRDSKLYVVAEGYKKLELDRDQITNLLNKSSKFYLEKEDSGTNTDESNSDIIQVFWDGSSSSKGRNLDKEIGFLKEYLKTKNLTKLELVVFNTDVVLQKEFDLQQGLDELENTLRGVKYAGGTSYKAINEIISGNALVFSDGWQTGEDLEIEYTSNGRIFFITSDRKADHKKLVKSGAFYNGSYLPLFTIRVTEALDIIRTGRVIQLSDISTKQDLFTGTVVADNGPLQGVIIKIRGEVEEYASKSNGVFTIPASYGDILQLRFLGMHPKDVLLEENMDTTISMTSKDLLLDEVVLEGKKAKSEKINTGYGVENKDKLGYAVNTITSADIKSNAQFLSDVIRGRFAGVQVTGFGNEAVYKMRGAGFSINNERPPIWVVDGAIFTETPTFVDVQNIASISIVKSSLAAIRYGTVATGGAFLIQTKAFARQENKGEIVDLALVKGNDYNEITKELTSNNEATYIQKIKQSGDLKAQWETFEKLSKGFDANAEFLVDTALYFEVLDKAKAQIIRERLIEMAHRTPRLLRVASYLLEQASDYKKLAQVQKQIVYLAPQEAQSYYDLARSYKLSGEYNKALELYINMLAEQIVGVDFKSIEKPISHELLRLVALHKDQIDYERLPNEWLPTDFGLDLRMELSWSDSGAPFEFQFVNPKKKFFKWNHTLEENRERLMDEAKAGYNTEEFVIDDAPHGLWIVNLEYFGELSQEDTFPTYLKYTVYRNYGTDSEQKEVKIIKLTSDITKGKLHEFLL